MFLSEIKLKVNICPVFCWFFFKRTYKTVVKIRPFLPTTFCSLRINFFSAKIPGHQDHLQTVHENVKTFTIDAQTKTPLFLFFIPLSKSNLVPHWLLFAVALCWDHLQLLTASNQQLFICADFGLDC